MQPTKVHGTENKMAQIKRQCKLARSIKAKRHKITECKTRTAYIYKTIKFIILSYTIF
jgi:hypothetical protein